MLRSVFTLNRTECNRVRHETRHNPKTLSDLDGVGRPRCRPVSLQKHRPERFRRSLVLRLAALYSPDWHIETGRKVRFWSDQCSKSEEVRTLKDSRSKAREVATRPTTGCIRSGRQCTILDHFRPDLLLGQVQGENGLLPAWSS
jgi:hypothetical protein